MTDTAAPGEDPGPRQTSTNPHRARILKIARTWIGTPFHHRASLRGVGTDCLGLIRGIWRELHGEEPEPLPDYTPDWAEATGREDMQAAALRHLIPVQTPQPGDVLLFRLKRTGPARHAGILSESTAAPHADPGPRWTEYRTLIHAASPHPVTEEPFTPSWQRRTAAAFAFPSPHLLRKAEKPHVLPSTQPSSCENAASKFAAARSSGSM